LGKSPLGKPPTPSPAKTPRDERAGVSLGSPFPRVLGGVGGMWAPWKKNSAPPKPGFKNP